MTNRTFLPSRRLLTGVLVLSALASITQAQTVRASTSSSGAQANGASPGASGARISGNGQFVVFRSLATNLTADATNSVSQIFRKNLTTGATQLVSVGGAGGGNGDSFNPSASADGRFVSFTSHSDDLVAGDSNGQKDVFVRDMNSGTTTLVSTDGGGGQGTLESDSSAMSADGQTIVFRSLSNNWGFNDSNGVSDVFVKNMGTGALTLVSVDQGNNGAGNGESGYLTPGISADGRYVGFSSLASNLVAGDTNAKWDVFRRDLQTSTTERVSVSSSEVQGTLNSHSSQLSADGRYVAFVSFSANLVSGDTNGQLDVFVRDCTSGTTIRASLSYQAKQVTGGASGDGNADGTGISISADGRYVAYQSLATNVVAKDTNGKSDVFVWDRNTNKSSLVSVNTSAKVANGTSTVPSISDNGLKVSFASEATDLVSGDTNGLQDVFVRG